MAFKAPEHRLVIDTREQLPYVFEDCRTVRATLGAGDYSIEGFEHRVAVERKSKQDAYGVLGSGRARFVRCLERLSQLDRACVVIECSQADFCEPPGYVERINAATAVGSYISWACQYRIPVFWCDNRAFAERTTLRFLAAYVKHRGGLIAT